MAERKPFDTAPQQECMHSDRDQHGRCRTCSALVKFVMFFWSVGRME
jgi:hypothetical protein